MALLLLLSYGLSFIPPKHFAFLSVLSLAVPFLILINILFVLYWLLKFRRQLWLSIFVLLMGYGYMSTFIQWSSPSNSGAAESFSVMSYNVRLFNRYNWIDDDSIAKSIVSFITNDPPSVLCLQEYETHPNIDFESYRYSYNSGQSSSKSGLAIFSNYKMINSGTINFPDSSNNAIFTDLIIEKDTVRVYNLHLQSARIDPNFSDFNSEKSNRLFRRMSSTFKAQNLQVDLVLDHQSKSNYKSIICGDFNNTAFSYIYRVLSENMIDSFEIAGSGFGRTYDFTYFPFRIDYILVDPGFKVVSFENYDIKLSDHYPIRTIVTKL